MGRFGSLFRKSDEKEKAEPTSNPYAQQPSTDTYTQSNSYAAAQNRQVPSGLPSGPRTGLPSGPRPGSSAPPPYTQSPSLYSKDSPTFPSDSKRQDSGYQTGSPAFSNYQQSPNLPSGGSSPAVGYGNDRFGAPAGYGSNRYDNYAAYEQNNHNTATSQRTGGYGGLGGSDNELFSNNFVPPSQRNPISAPALPDNYDQMTEEDKQEAEINYKKQEIKQLRGDTEASQLRSLAMLGVAHETADNAMDSLHRQREMINHTNDAMRRANVQARVAEANVKDLRDANKSMFNPYAMSRKRREALNEERLIAEMQERDEKYQMQQELRQGNAQANQRAQGGPSPSFFAIPKQDRSRFDFENDEEDEEQEQRISNNEELLYKGVTLLKHKAINMGEEVEDQNPMIRQLNEKADIINDKVRKNHNDIKPYGA